VYQSATAPNKYVRVREHWIETIPRARARRRMSVNNIGQKMRKVGSRLATGSSRTVNCAESDPFPSQHDAVAHGQTDVLDAWVGLHQPVESNDGMIVIIFRVDDSATPQNVITYD